jgi:triphosphoribosyl-dephospho-CoA synthetase
MTDHTELVRLLEQASEQGAARALTHLGLADESAGKDMADLRELLSAWRDAKRSARKAVIEWLVRGCLAMLVIGLAFKLGLAGLVLK